MWTTSSRNNLKRNDSEYVKTVERRQDINSAVFCFDRLGVINRRDPDGRKTERVPTCRAARHILPLFFIFCNMKKLCAIFAAVMTALTVILLSACGSDAMESVSERRSGYFYAEADGFSVTAVSGVREDPYDADGKAGSLKPYTLLTVVPKDFDIDAVYTYTAETNRSAYGGTLIVHPFAASFSAEFDAEASAEFSVTINNGQTNVRLKLISLVTSEMIKYDRAVDAAKTALKPKGSYETRVRLIKNPLDGDGLCWHVAFYYKDSVCGVLLDPVTAKVLAKKTH